MKDTFIEIESGDLLRRAAGFKQQGARLIQILCTRVPEGYELSYSFDLHYELTHLRLVVPEGGSVMSVTGLYWPAFVWENEIHDLFGLNVEFIAPEVDYKGKFFLLKEPQPWHALSGAQQPKQAVKVNLRSGLGIDASVKPAAGAAPANKAAQGVATAVAEKPAEAKTAEAAAQQAAQPAKQTEGGGQHE